MPAPLVGSWPRLSECPPLRLAHGGPPVTFLPLNPKSISPAKITGLGFKLTCPRMFRTPSHGCTVSQPFCANPSLHLCSRLPRGDQHVSQRLSQRGGAEGELLPSQSVPNLTTSTFLSAIPFPLHFPCPTLGPGQLAPGPPPRNLQTVVLSSPCLPRVCSLHRHKNDLLGRQSPLRQGPSGAPRLACWVPAPCDVTPACLPRLSSSP